MPVLVAIPARLGSTRLPRKPLQPLGGVPLIIRVVERVHASGVGDRVVVATDAEEIASVVAAAGFEAVLTAERHPSGTDRVHEVSSRADFADYHELLNVQGDSPFISAAAMRGSLEQLRKGFDIGTASVPLDPALADDPTRVKVVSDGSGRALYFSRAAIPFSSHSEPAEPGYRQHLGVYAYSRATLGRLAGFGPSPLERREGLEQLRALERGLSIGVERIGEPVPLTIDTPEDLLRAEALWQLTHEVTR
jgi:3-deoxy-manno-octulosonate cytidylyltransferase (CMP-KDO synthetase)